MMHYIQHILLPNEEVLYDGHVHPRVLLPGLLLMGLAALILMQAAGTGDSPPVLLKTVYWLTQYFPSINGFYTMLWRWQNASPNTALEIKVIALFFALCGFMRLAYQFIIMQTTELVVTNRRIIAKTGILTVITLEMDRNRVAGVTVDQSFAGRIMGYGTVTIQGFTATIGGLPIMVNPHLVEQFVS